MLVTIQSTGDTTVNKVVKNVTSFVPCDCEAVCTNHLKYNYIVMSNVVFLVLTHPPMLCTSPWISSVLIQCWPSWPD